MSFVYATYNSSGGYFIIYLKNVGSQPIHAIDRATLVFGNVTSATFYVYNSSGGAGTWRYV
jgi:archaellum component FlaG (FlaF/FlaG flagellin family)